MRFVSLRVVSFFLGVSPVTSAFEALRGFLCGRRVIRAVGVNTLEKFGHIFRMKYPASIFGMIFFPISALRLPASLN